MTAVQKDRLFPLTREPLPHLRAGPRTSGSCAGFGCQVLFRRALSFIKAVLPVKAARAQSTHSAGNQTEAGAAAETGLFPTD